MRGPIERNRARLTATERTQLDTRGWRDRHPDEYPPVAADCRPADYAHDLDRGTLDYSTDWKNYSFHKVRIPAGTVIVGANFTQTQPDTAAITVIGVPSTVAFIDCNLGNVRLHPAWALKDCNTAQSWIIGDIEGNEERQWIARHPDDLPAMVVKPAKAVTMRGF